MLLEVLIFPKFRAVMGGKLIKPLMAPEQCSRATVAAKLDGRNTENGTVDRKYVLRTQLEVP